MTTTTIESAVPFTVDQNRIVSTPDTCGGKPRIAGSRIRVQDIYWWHEVAGKSADEIVTDFPQLSMADVYAALAYFWTHREPMLAEFEAERKAYEEHKSSQPSLLRDRIRQPIADDAADHSVPS